MSSGCWICSPICIVRGRTIVMVTHNPALGQFADRILRLQHGKYLGEEANQHALA
ncbi:Uncharacterised protein [Citrobacter koseri]|uniref:ABC transporter ATP-binding protein n=1 Tax=Citrobacter koseri TaxID=545 RepID=A0A2X2XNF6_CITKO|nr:Uncharacterised protein [Citrobacter koseri]